MVKSVHLSNEPFSVDGQVEKSSGPCSRWNHIEEDGQIWEIWTLFDDLHVCKSDGVILEVPIWSKSSSVASVGLGGRLHVN